MIPERNGEVDKLFVVLQDHLGGDGGQSHNEDDEEEVFEGEGLGEDDGEEGDDDEEEKRFRQKRDDDVLGHLLLTTTSGDVVDDVRGGHISDEEPDGVGSIPVAKVVLDVADRGVPAVLSKSELGAKPGSGEVRFQSSGSSVLKKISSHYFLRIIATLAFSAKPNLTQSSLRPKR